MISNDVASAAKHAPRRLQLGLPSKDVSLPAFVRLSAVRTHRLPSCVRPVHDPDMTTEGLGDVPNLMGGAHGCAHA